MAQIILSEQQAALYEAGWHDARRIEDDCRDLADQFARNEPVIVVDLAQRVLFALTPGERRPV